MLKLPLGKHEVRLVLKVTALYHINNKYLNVNAPQLWK